MKQTMQQQQLDLGQQKKKEARRNRAINLAQLRAKKYTEVDLGEYTEILGDIEGNSTIMAYGRSGSGKSVFVLQLVDYLAEKYGKVLYNSHEEKLNKTLQDRVNSFNIKSEKIYFAAAWGYEEMMGWIKTNKYRVVVIDSVQYMKFTYAQFIELRSTFRKRNIIVILVSFGKGLGQTDSADQLLHASDVKLHFEKGKLTSISRYLSKPYTKRLFKPSLELLEKE